MADDQGFDYVQWESTNCIIFHDINGVPRYDAWRPTPIPNPLQPIVDIENPHGALTICSSSRGFIACRDAQSNYYIGNPFAQDIPEYIGNLAPPPNLHHPDLTHVVLVIHHPDPPEGLLPRFHIICAVRKRLGVYTFHAYSSNTDQWVSHPLINLQQRNIVANTGVSCGRFAYWLTENPRSVLRFDAMAGNNISFLELPPHIPPPAEARIQLGRVGDMMGLVIVNEANSTLELYTRRLDENWWIERAIFNVQIEPGANMVCRLLHGTLTLVCRDMPRPMRFESFKMELVLWVAERVVLLETSAIQQNSYRLTVMFPAVPASILDGLPYVCTDLLPTDLDLG